MPRARARRVPPATHGERVARRIRSVTVGINGYVPDLASPYGGVKAGGLGSELGPEGLQAYRRFQSVYRQ